MKMKRKKKRRKRKAKIKGKHFTKNHRPKKKRGFKPGQNISTSHLPNLLNFHHVSISRKKKRHQTVSHYYLVLKKSQKMTLIVF